MLPERQSEEGRTKFESLPDDVLGNIFERLYLGDMIGLSQLCRVMKQRVTTLGIPSYLARHPQYHLTLSRPASDLTPTDLLRHHTHINRSLSTNRWHALQVGPTWPSAVIPAMSLAPDRLIYGVGGKLIVHDLATAPFPGDETDGPGGRRELTRSVKRGKEYHVARKWAGSKADIIGVAELHDQDRQLIVAQFDGTLQRLYLPKPNSEDGSTIRSTAHYSHPPNSDIQTLSVSAGHMLTTTSSGLVSLFKANAPWAKATTLQLGQKTRAWSSLLSLDHSGTSPTALIGISGSIDLYNIEGSGSISPKPVRQLVGPKSPSRSSPYDIHQPPSTSWHNPQALLSAWYDSHIRLHDLRLPTPNPVINFNDPWADSPMYSCAFTGTYHVVGGGARHGMVGFWDVRYPKGGEGWSCFTPGGKGSPVYQLAGEGGRVWGVTEKRGFVLGFDGSGEDLDGLVYRHARAEVRVGRPVEVPSQYRSRGGKWGWSVRYETEEKEVGIGYRHRDRVVKLFDSLPVR